MPNRKERRAAKKAESATDIPLAQPNRSTPSAKTLYDLAAERSAELRGWKPSSGSSNGKGPTPQLVNKIINPDGTISEDNPQPEAAPESGEEPIGPLGDAVLYTISLTLLHLTLDILIHNQYAEEIFWDRIIPQTLRASVMIFVLVYLLHSRAAEVWAQGLFLATCMASGCYLSYVSSENPMLVVMKRAPPLGTLWVWSVVEMRLEFAVLGLAVVAAYFFKQGYTIF